MWNTTNKNGNIMEKFWIITWNSWMQPEWQREIKQNDYMEWSSNENEEFHFNSIVEPEWKLLRGSVRYVMQRAVQAAYRRCHSP